MHSWISGFLSAKLAELYTLPDKDLIFVAGLVHDIGKLILSKYLPVEYKLILARAETEDIDEIVLETECLQFNHAILGAQVLRSWRMPEKIADIVEKHHTQNLEEITNLHLKCVVIANIITNQYGYTFLKKKYNLNINPEKILNISREKLENLIEESRKSVPKFI
jgi:putative nucleotidyltransferase with HDIG domain